MGETTLRSKAMSKKNVLFVAHHLTIGGVQKSLVSALNYIDYESNNVTLYIRKNRIDLLPYINDNVKVIANNDRHHYYRYPYAVLLQLAQKMKGLFKKDTTSIETKLKKYIHDKRKAYEKKHYFESKKYDVAVAYCEGYPSEFVMDCVTSDRKIMFFQSSVDSNHTIHQRIMPQFDAIIVEHPDIKKALTRWYQGISSLVQVLENYTDYSFIKKLSQEKAVSNGNDVFVLCTCSRFSPEKGLDLAVEAAKILKDRGINFIWYLVGDGLEKEKIDKFVEANQLQKYIIMPGMQKNPYPYMSACDIYVQPSREEALSISMLESQVLCAPMVSTKTAGGLAMIQEGVNGLLADINAEALANTIENLIQNDDLRNSIKDYLRSIDYSEEEIRYKNDWKELLNY